jgi:hypothetical protein
MRNTNQILTEAQQTLKTAELGLKGLKTHNSEHKDAGLRNLIVFGRAITNVLQNLRSTEKDFDAWYNPFAKEMENDKFLKFFYNARSTILKEGSVPATTHSFYIKKFNSNDINKFEKPPFAKSFFMGDKYGGSGWEVVFPDGRTEKFYIDLPVEIGEGKVFISNLPKEHLGKEVEGITLEEAGQLYFDYLANLLRKAEDRFKS